MLLVDDVPDGHQVLRWQAGGGRRQHHLVETTAAVVGRAPDQWRTASRPRCGKGWPTCSRSEPLLSHKKDSTCLIPAVDILQLMIVMVLQFLVLDHLPAGVKLSAEMVKAAAKENTERVAAEANRRVKRCASHPSASVHSLCLLLWSFWRHPTATSVISRRCIVMQAEGVGGHRGSAPPARSRAGCAAADHHSPAAPAGTGA